MKEHYSQYEPLLGQLKQKYQVICDESANDMASAFVFVYDVGHY